MSDIQVLVPLSVFQMVDGMDATKNVEALVKADERNRALQREVDKLAEELRDAGAQLEHMLDTVSNNYELSQMIRRAIGALKSFKSPLESRR